MPATSRSSSGGVRSVTAPHQNTWPITAARCRTERSRGSSRSSRAASTAWTVSGTRIDSTSVSACRRPSRSTSRALLDEHAQHLLEEERVAAGCAADGVGGVLVERAREILEQLPRVVALQRRQLDRRRSGPRRPQLREIAAGEAADENRRVPSPAREVLDQIKKRRLRPLDVVENEQHGPLTRKRLEQPAEGPVQLVAARVWLGATDGLEEPAVHGLTVGLPHQDRIEVEPADDLDERPVGDSVSVGQAAALEDVRILAQRRDQFGSKARLADAGVAEDGDDTAGPFQHDLVDSRARRRAGSTTRPRAACRPAAFTPAAPGSTSVRRHTATGSDFPFASAAGRFGHDRVASD